jgi:hypothetical protein
MEWTTELLIGPPIFASIALFFDESFARTYRR